MLLARDSSVRGMLDIECDTCLLLYLSNVTLRQHTDTEKDIRPEIKEVLIGDAKIDKGVVRGKKQ